MFDLKKALSAVPDGTMAYQSLKERIVDIIWAHRNHLDPNYSCRDVLDEGFSRGWFQMTDPDTVVVNISTELRPAPLHPCPFVASGGFHGDDCLGLSRNQELERVCKILAEIRKEVNSVKGTYKHPDQLERAVLTAFTNIASILENASL